MNSLISQILFIALGILLCVLTSCKKEPVVTVYNYGTQSDSALVYFNKGWEYILDYGLWTKSEEAFRKSVEFDSTFLIGHGLVGKISRDLEERIEILNRINREKHLISQDNLLLLEITAKTIEFFYAKELDSNLDPGFYEEFKRLGEDNYRKFVHKYPNESYMKAEYIEFINANHGPGPALDSLNKLASSFQKELPFYITYGAFLKAELGEYNDALKDAEKFEKVMVNKSVPAVNVIYAQIYNEMDSFDLAKSYIEKAIELDSNHIIAQRLFSQIKG